MRSIEHTAAEEGPITPFDQGTSLMGSSQSIRKDPFFHIGKQFNQRVNEVKSLKNFASQLLKDLDSDDDLYSGSRGAPGDETIRITEQQNQSIVTAYLPGHNNIN